MEIQLAEHLTQTIPYTRPELDWLLAHIGDPAAAIRDELVYQNFVHGIVNQLIEKKDFRYLADSLLDGKWLFFKEMERGTATLTRSFSALLLSLIIGSDGFKDSAYFHCLSD